MAETEEKPQAFVFLLTDQFSMMAFAAAIEPLRQANRLSRRDLYSWQIASEGGGPVTCSNGCTIAADIGLTDLSRDTAVVVCTGINLRDACSRPILAWLRTQTRRGVRMGSVCTGAHVLAKAGLLDGKRCTIHWENQAAFAEEFPETEISNLLYCMDGDVFTCAGGTAAADMMLQLIAERHGPDLAALVADAMIHAPVRSDADEQRLSVPARIGDGLAEDVVAFNITLADGSVGAIHYFANGHKAMSKEQFRVFWEERVLEVDNYKKLRGFGVKGVDRSLWSLDKGHKAGFEAFLTAVAKGEASPIPLDQLLNSAEAALVAQQLIDAGGGNKLLGVASSDLSKS